MGRGTWHGPTGSCIIAPTTLSDFQTADRDSPDVDVVWNTSASTGKQHFRRSPEELYQKIPAGCGESWGLLLICFNSLHWDADGGPVKSIPVRDPRIFTTDLCCWSHILN